MGAARPTLNTAPQQGDCDHDDDLNMADRLIRQLAEAGAGAGRKDGDEVAPQHESCTVGVGGVRDGKAYGPSSYQHGGGGGDGPPPFDGRGGGGGGSVEEELRLQARIAEENTRRMEEALDGHRLGMDRGGGGGGGAAPVSLPPGAPNADCVRSIFRCLEGASAGLVAAVLEATAGTGGGGGDYSVGGVDGYEPVVSVVAPVAGGGSYQNVAVPHYGTGTGAHRHKGKGRLHSARGNDAGGYSTSPSSSERNDLLQAEG